MSEKFWVIVGWKNECNDVIECGSWASAKACRDEVLPLKPDRVADIEIFDAQGLRLWSCEEPEQLATCVLEPGRWKWRPENESSNDVRERFRKVGEVHPLLALWGVSGGTRMKQAKAAGWRPEFLRGGDRGGSPK